MRHSLIGRLNLFIKRYTVVSAVFVLVVAFIFGFVTYRNGVLFLRKESFLWSEYLTDFSSLLKRETSPKDGTAYAFFEDGALYVNSRANGSIRTFVITRDDLPENVLIISPDGDSFSGRVGFLPEGKAKIGKYIGYVKDFPVGESRWKVFVGEVPVKIIYSHSGFLSCLALVSFLYAWFLRVFLVKTKDSLAKDLGVLKSLVETFAKQGEIPVLSGTESWEIRSLAKILYDVSQKMKEEQYKALQKAGTDELTGLANRRALEEKLDQRILQNRTFSLIFMDLNGFKSVNDILGHDKGDEVLKEVADKLKKVFRSYDFIARWGGDEFAVLFEGDAEKQLDELKKRILRALSEIKIEKELKIGAAIGCAVWPVDGKTPGELLKTADERMYADKIISKSIR
ncbi:MAG: GGDEF domain-containing protein [Acetomicrobium sp.]|jgi:diguanylate cyclase (GGDEF)-like protein